MPLSYSVKHSRRIMKMEKIARLEIVGYTDEEIAMAVGITKQYVSMLRRTPMFIGIRTQVASGILAESDRLLMDDVEVTHDQIKQMVPNAILALRNTLHNRANPKLQFEAAKEILDREGTFAKVSKSEIKKTEVFTFADDAITTDLLQALQGNSKQPLDTGEEDFVNSSLASQSVGNYDDNKNVINMPSRSKEIQ